MSWFTLRRMAPKPLIHITFVWLEDRNSTEDAIVALIASGNEKHETKDALHGPQTLNY